MDRVQTIYFLSQVFGNVFKWLRQSQLSALLVQALERWSLKCEAVFSLEFEARLIPGKYLLLEFLSGMKPQLHASLIEWIKMSF